MWRMAEFSREAFTLNFDASIGRSLIGSRVTVNKALLTNAAELVDWENSPVQLRVCHHCGGTGCSAGNYVNIESSGNDLVFFPAFEQLSCGEFESNEYYPPDIIQANGLALLSITDARTYLFELTNRREIRPLKSTLIPRILQFEAPDCILGKCPDIPRLQANRVFATSVGETTDICADFERLLNSFTIDNAKQVLFRPQSKTDEPISIYFESNRWQSWEALVMTPDGIRFRLNPGFVVERA